MNHKRRDSPIQQIKRTPQKVDPTEEGGTFHSFTVLVKKIIIVSITIAANISKTFAKIRACTAGEACNIA